MSRASAVDSADDDLEDEVLCDDTLGCLLILTLRVTEVLKVVCVYERVEANFDLLWTSGCFYCLNAIRRVVANRSSMGHHRMGHESADPCPDCCKRSTAAPVQPLASCRDSIM
jgi:hypothetical protein